MKFYIREIRENKGFRLTELARKMDVSKAALSKWENRKSGDPMMTLRTLGRIAAALDVSIKDLFEEEKARR